jgi:hypothetical protein
MVYSEVIKNNYHKILPEKKKYTQWDLNKVLTESFFNSNLNNGRTFSLTEARFIVLCTALFYDVEVSQTIYNFNSNKKII